MERAEVARPCPVARLEKGKEGGDLTVCLKLDGLLQDESRALVVQSRHVAINETAVARESDRARTCRRAS